ncbi:uncharacterized protein PAC_05436 [Phialocephala subalpina]|uniref:Uncharacterized protein n=1 Tax=Phialocephala subalpina TaxID=576137 RepID=A0A1L7WRZ9_9HELO|nr:uncharacterized protein PAC_05436 [Phialocephala subalpina]
MRAVDFDTLTTAASDVESAYDYQFQPRVDGQIIADTSNLRAYSGVNATADVSTYLKIFPAITDDVVDEILALYPDADYTSPGLRFADTKQSFDLTAYNLALTHAMNNQT